MGAGVVIVNDAGVRRFVLTHFLVVLGEWAATVGVLVHAYEWSGTTAVGLTSLAVLAPTMISAPVAAALTARHRPHRVRLAGLGVEVAAYGAAAIAAGADAPTPVVAAFVVIALGAVGTLRPTGAALLPTVVRTTPQLVGANLWVAGCDSSSALAGPLAAAALGAIGGPTAVFCGCAVGSLVGLGLTAWRPAALAKRAAVATHVVGNRAIRRAAAELRRRPWTIGVFGVASARNIVVGAFDVLLVVVALRSLDLGEQGPGLLSALVGGGALVSAFVAAAVVRAARLGPTLVAVLIGAALLCLGLSTSTRLPVVVIMLPVIGACLSLMDNISRMLLQRSTDPRQLGPVFACLGLVSGAGQLVGSALAQLLLAVGSVATAFAGLGSVLVVIAVVNVRSLRRADSEAEIPVVEMMLLAGVPMFGPLPPITLETIARAAEPVEIGSGTAVVVQGEAGDTFYAVAEGEFDIVMSGEFIRTAGRGDFFGEVALLTERTRTATVTARGDGRLLAIHREPFLLAVTGHEVSHGAALDYLDTLRYPD